MNLRNAIVRKHFEQNYGTLVKVISRRAGNNVALAEEVVSEAYARALKYFRVFNSDNSSFATWFSEILKNSFKDSQRAERLRGVYIPIEEAYDVPDDARSAYNRAVEKDILNGIANDIKQVGNETHQKVLELFYVKGLMYYEIAELVSSLTESNIKLIVSRFRPFLRDKYRA